MLWKELIGIVATLFVLASMLFPTSSYKGDLRMRILSLIGSVIFLVYGILIPAISTAVLNGILIFVNCYYIVRLVMEHKKELESGKEKPEENNTTK